MASQAGCEIINSEVVGSIPTVIPIKEKKRISHVQEPVKFTHLNNDESITIIAIHSNTEKSWVKWDAGNLIGVPDTSWGIRQV